ncbi:MAG: hypothetical protein LBH00_07725, partial [Planctomycetaceae bacterium]|nr:hypothetical protein [Planctomycetaceae bacterium]
EGVLPEGFALIQVPNVLDSFEKIARFFHPPREEKQTGISRQWRGYRESFTACSRIAAFTPGLQMYLCLPLQYLPTFSLRQCGH